MLTFDQAAIFAILVATLGLFLWGRWRFDVVALAALLAAVVVGVVPTADAFLGFGSPAVITVACVLVISRSLQNSGVLDHAADWLLTRAKQEASQRLALSGVGAVLSGFMNNVGALALLMPLALRLAKEPARVLMPLSFASILGGLVTLIGTPPNIIIANYRSTVADAPFRMFDFAFVGLPVALLGLGFLLLIGWRLIPTGRKGRRAADSLFDVGDYMAEVQIPEDSEYAGRPARVIEDSLDGDILVVGMTRDGKRQFGHLSRRHLRAGDIVLVRAGPAALEKLVQAKQVTLGPAEDLSEEQLRNDEIGLIEAVVPPGSRIEGRTPNGLALRRRYGATLLALAREGGNITSRVGRTRLRAGDVMLLQGAIEDLPETVARLSCLPLAERGLAIGRPRRLLLPIAIFATAIVATAVGWLPVHIAFALAVLLLVLSEQITMREAYDSVDWPVILLLAAMIPLGQALEATGGTAIVAGGIVAIAGSLPPAIVLAALLIVTMTLSDVLNNAATAIVMAPIAVSVAGQLGANPDAFLMAVALGASAAFLTPIGHQNNVLVMGPGGYRFGDYWRMGLPLEILIVAAAVPLILWAWPL